MLCAAERGVFMGEIMKELKAWGCDLEGTAERFDGDETLYLECLSMLTADAAFEELGEKLSAAETERAFDCAHALKGVIANMGITPMFDTIVQIVEPLRRGTMPEAEEKTRLFAAYEKLMRQNRYLKSLIGDTGK